MKRLLLASLCLLLLIPATPALATTQHCPDHNGHPGKVEGNSNSVVLDNGVEFCVKAGPYATGPLMADGVRTLSEYVRDSGIRVGNGDNVPDVSYYISYTPQYEPSPEPTPSPSPTPNPEPSPKPSPTPSPMPSPTPSPTPEPTPSPTTIAPTPSPTPTVTPSPWVEPSPEIGEPLVIEREEPFEQEEELPSAGTSLRVLGIALLLIVIGLILSRGLSKKRLKK